MADDDLVKRLHGLSLGLLQQQQLRRLADSLTSIEVSDSVGGFKSGTPATSIEAGAKGIEDQGYHAAVKAGFQAIEQHCSTTSTATQPHSIRTMQHNLTRELLLL